MKKIVLYIDNMNRGGAQRVMTNLCEHYVETGIQVVLVNDYPADEKKTTYRIPQSVKRLYLQSAYSRDPIINNICRLYTLRKILKKEKPQIALSFLGGPNIRLLIASTGLDHKTVISVRNDPNKEYAAAGIKKSWIRKLFERADGCVFQTNEAQAYFTERVREKSAVIFNPVDEKFYAVARTCKPGTIVTAGRMNEQKRHDLLIDAFALLVEDNPNVELVIYGEGSLRQQLNEKIDTYGLHGRVHLPGNVANLEEKLESANVFVLSSDYEGMPNALMEAMAAGVPCISTNCPCGGPKALDGGTGAIRLVECGDTEGLYLAMREIIENDELSYRMGAKAKERAVAFKPEVVYAEWDNYLFKVVGQCIN